MGTSRSSHDRLSTFSRQQTLSQHAPGSSSGPVLPKRLCLTSQQISSVLSLVTTMSCHATDLLLTCQCLYQRGRLLGFALQLRSLGLIKVRNRLMVGRCLGLGDHLLNTFTVRGNAECEVFTCRHYRFLCQSLFLRQYAPKNAEDTFYILPTPRYRDVRVTYATSIPLQSPQSCTLRRLSGVQYARQRDIWASACPPLLTAKG